MKEYIVCDQNGKPFTEDDVKKFTDKQVKKIGYVNNGFLMIKVNDGLFTEFEGPTQDTKVIHSFIKDNKGNVKVIDMFVVKEQTQTST